MTIKLATLLATSIVIVAQTNAMDKRQRSQQLQSFSQQSYNNPYNPRKKAEQGSKNRNLRHPVTQLSYQQFLAIQHQVNAKQAECTLKAQQDEQQIGEINKYLAMPGLPENRRKQLNAILQLSAKEQPAVAGIVLDQLKNDPIIQKIVNPVKETKQFTHRSITEDGELERSITQIVEEKGSPKKLPQQTNEDLGASLFKWQPETCFSTKFNVPVDATTVVLPRIKKVDPVTFNDWSQSLSNQEEKQTWRVASFNDRQNETFKLF